MHGFARAVDSAVRERKCRHVAALRFASARIPAEGVRKVRGVPERNPGEVGALRLDGNRRRALFALKAFGGLEVRAAFPIRLHGLDHSAVFGEKACRHVGGGLSVHEACGKDVDRGVGRGLCNDGEVREKKALARGRDHFFLPVLHPDARELNLEESGTGADHSFGKIKR